MLGTDINVTDILKMTKLYSTAYGFVWCSCDTDSDTDRMFSYDKDLAWDAYEDARLRIYHLLQCSMEYNPRF